MLSDSGVICRRIEAFNFNLTLTRSLLALYPLLNPVLRHVYTGNIEMYSEISYYENKWNLLLLTNVTRYGGVLAIHRHEIKFTYP